MGAVDAEAQQRIKLATGANSHRRLLVFDAITSSSHQLVDGPAEHLLTINTNGVYVFAYLRPCSSEQSIRLATRKPPLL